LSALHRCHCSRTLAREASMAKAIVLLTVVTFVAIGLLASEAWAGKKPSSLSQHAVKGQHYMEVTITHRKAGGGPKSPGKPTFGNAR
jgi:hypothetical protein